MYMMQHAEVSEVSSGHCPFLSTVYNNAAHTARWEHCQCLFISQLTNLYMTNQPVQHTITNYQSAVVNVTVHDNEIMIKVDQLNPSVYNYNHFVLQHQPYI